MNDRALGEAERERIASDLVLHVDAESDPRSRGRQVHRSTGDLVMRRVLFLPLDAPAGTAEGARQAFQTSMMVAAVRCVLMYLVFPFVLPAVGIATGIGPVIGLVVNLAAMVCIVFSMRRFWRSDHPQRWWYGVLGGTVMCFLVYLAIDDVVTLLT